MDDVTTLRALLLDFGYGTRQKPRQRYVANCRQSSSGPESEHKWGCLRRRALPWPATTGLAMS